MTDQIKIKNNEKQFIALRNAVKFSGAVTGDGNPSDRRVRSITHAYQEEEVQQLAVLNPWSGNVWTDIIMDQPFPKQSPDYRLFCITMLSEDWNIDLSLQRSGAQLHDDVLRLTPKVKQSVRNWLNGICEFLMMVELALHDVDGRQYLCLHVHGLGWGQENSLKARLKALPPGMGNAKGGFRKPCADRAGWVRYMAKDARLKSITNRLPDYKGKKRYFKASQVLTKKDQFTFIQAIRDLTKPEMAFASGQAAAILRGAKRDAISQGYVPQARGRNI